ncbi:MAG: bacterial transcriptional activator domain-containing protein, partial [Micrococcales bacterium]|nr:bacterial transcriptional activator domain-containing protein [Micrococcales bacterium]
PDATYLDVAATTAEDLAVLAPRVPAEVRQEVLAADPRLDEDIAAWYAVGPARPRVRVLGPVRVVACGTPPARRGAFFTELVTYLALHPDGVTPAQVAEALDTSRAKAREYLRIVQAWLGTDPVTGQPYLTGTDDDQPRQVQALVDLDLFRRLRVRAQARGAEGTDDLLAALHLVAGRPFDDPATWRPGGWAWLVEDRTDEAALIAIIDTAHTVVTHALATEDLPTARLAAETAQTADPYDEVIRLDLAAVASAEGRYAEAARIVADEIGNRSDDGHAPPDLSDRTQEIIIAHPDWRTTRAS